MLQLFQDELHLYDDRGTRHHFVCQFIAQAVNIFTRLPELLLLSTNKPQEISIPFNIAEAPVNKLGGVKAAVCVPDKFLEIFGETAGENSVEDAVPGGFL